MKKEKLLIAGGKDDPNLQRLIECAKEKNISIVPLLIEPNYSPAFTWQLEKDTLWIDEKSQLIDAAFIRRNVFQVTTTEDKTRSAAWYSSMNGYLMMHENIKIVNRSYLGKYTNKLHVLGLAQQAGLNIPATLITNVPADFDKISSNELIAKPVLGGGYCEEIKLLMRDPELQVPAAANPAIVQQKIKGDDIRIYRIGKLFIGFQIRSTILDYRKSKKHEIKIIKKLPKKIIQSLKKIMDKMGLNWGAADFKKSEKSAEYYFLEVNSNPMFVAFDKICAGEISNGLLDFLLKK